MLGSPLNNRSIGFRLALASAFWAGTKSAFWKTSTHIVNHEY
jgi:hypothetical protein